MKCLIFSWYNIQIISRGRKRSVECKQPRTASPVHIVHACFGHKDEALSKTLIKPLEIGLHQGWEYGPRRMIIWPMEDNAGPGRGMWVLTLGE